MKQQIVKTKQNLLGMAVIVILTALTFYIIFKDNSISKLISAISQTNLWFIGLGFLCMVLFVSCEAGIIRMMLKSFSKKITWRKALNYSFAGFYFSSITPSATGGQPMQAYYMMRDGIGLAQSSFTLLAITSSYQLVVLLYGILMLVIRSPIIDSTMLLMKWLLAFGILMNGLSVFFLFFVMFKKNIMKKVSLKIIGLLARLHIIKDKKTIDEKLENSIEEYGKGGLYLKQNPSLYVKILFLTIVQLTALYVVPCCVYLALGISGNSFLDIIAAQAILGLAVSAVPLPGSVGASEGGFLVLYQMIFSKAYLLPAMILSRGISFYLFLVISGIVALKLQICLISQIHTYKDGCRAMSKKNSNQST